MRPFAAFLARALVLLLALRAGSALLAAPRNARRSAPRAAAIAADAADGLLVGVGGAPVTLETLGRAARALGSASDAVAVEVVSENRYPGSHSGVVRVAFADASAPSRLLFIKKVTPAYVDRPWPDCRRTLAYARTEARFYDEFAPAGSALAAAARAPRLALSDNRLDALLGEGSPVDAPAGDEPPSARMLEGGALLVLEAVEGCEQASPLDEARAARALRAAAALHAAGWEQAALLRRASERLQRHGGVFSLSIRNPSELARLRPNWEAFKAEFGGEAPALLRPSPSRLAELGARLEAWTPWVAAQLAPAPGDACATLVHGDFKAMNVMLPAGDAAAAPARLIDFASCGVGLGMADVAMLLAHSVAPSTLAEGGEERLLDAYLDALAEGGVKGYDRALATRHFHLATVDYARFVVSRFWGGASRAAFAKRAANQNVCLPNRDVEAALRFAERADASLRFLEEEGVGP